MVEDKARLYALSKYLGNPSQGFMNCPWRENPLPRQNALDIEYIDRDHKVG